MSRRQTCGDRWWKYIPFWTCTLYVVLQRSPQRQIYPEKPLPLQELLAKMVQHASHLFVSLVMKDWGANWLWWSSRITNYWLAWLQRQRSGVICSIRIQMVILCEAPICKSLLISFSRGIDCGVCLPLPALLLMTKSCLSASYSYFDLSRDTTEEVSSA